MADETAEENMWKETTEIATPCSRESFLDAIQVWIDKPHVVNRRLNGSLLVKRVFVSKEKRVALLDKVMAHGQRSDTGLFKWEDFLEELGKSDLEGNGSDSWRPEVILRRLLPRQPHRNCALIELVFLDKFSGIIYFFPLYLEPSSTITDGSPNKKPLNDFEMIPYRITHEERKTDGDQRLSLQTLSKINTDSIQGDGVVCPSIKWLGEHLLPKIKKWAEAPQDKKTTGSLRLISLEKYTCLYQKMKEKHGERLVKTWPESTDPQKFVYEDIAIATYLLILWEDERIQRHLQEKQSFVDIGCGNGLLVHLLAEEGHKGIGIDVRKRKIWSYFGTNTTLEERALDPTASGVFPEFDWLIGNHSDELTPWLPVMAARSSYNARYFVLPCCFYDFNCKFVRTNSKVSQYRGYLDFVRHVGITCGFEVEEDVLRIPSTKRTCQIGKLRNYPAEQQTVTEERIKDMIRKRGCDIDKGQRPSTLSSSPKHMNSTSEMADHSSSIDRSSTEITPLSPNSSLEAGECSGTDQTNEVPFVAGTETNAALPTDFKPRSPAIVVRNCTTVGRTLLDFIVNTVANALLAKEAGQHEIKPNSDLTGLTSTGKPRANWRTGGCLPLSDVAQMFGKEVLHQLKQECGGIQTLLRNHRHIFKVVGGTAQLRDWRLETPGPKLTGRDPAYLKRRYDALCKTTTCWFHLNHPDGCCCVPCAYAHGENELRDRPTAEYLKNL